MEQTVLVSLLSEAFQLGVDGAKIAQELVDPVARRRDLLV
jgi:hypothetical protein